MLFRSSKNIRVGGIAGTVTTGAKLSNVYMDIEVWYKSHEGCMLGGAFGGADAQYTVEDYIFAGRVGHTNNSNAISFKLASGKDMWLGQLTGNQNWKEDKTIKNVAAIGEKFVGAADSAQSGFIGTDLQWRYVHAYTGKKDMTYDHAASMVEAGWGWNETLQCLIPGNNVALVDGTYSHIVDYAKDMEVPELLYQVSDVVDGKYNIRFVSGINQLDLANQVGFDIELIVGGNSYKIDYSYTLTDTVYESIVGAGETVYAETYGYDYFYTREISGITATDSILIKISALTIDLAGNAIVGAPMTFSFVYGTGNVVSR